MQRDANELYQALYDLRWRMIFRVFALALHCLYGLFLCFFLARFSELHRVRVVRRWHQRVLTIFRVNATLYREGSPAIQMDVKTFQDVLQEPCLIVANHISWLDIHVIAAQLPVTFVAKADVMSWPVFGKLASAVNTIYLNRNKASDIKRVLQEMTARFNEGERICIFPEGTSSDGTSILPFKSNLFQAAVDRPVIVHPLLIEYRYQGKHTNAPGYYGDITLIESFLSLFKRPNIVAQITVLDPIGHCDARQEYCERSRERLILALDRNASQSHS